MKKYLRHLVNLGYFQGILTILLLQDLVGQERYLGFVRDHWIDSRITGPIETVLIVYVILRSYRLTDEKALEAERVRIAGLKP